MKNKFGTFMVSTIFLSTLYTGCAPQPNNMSENAAKLQTPDQKISDSANSDNFLVKNLAGCWLENSEDGLSKYPALIMQNNKEEMVYVSAYGFSKLLTTSGSLITKPSDFVNLTEMQKQYILSFQEGIGVVNTINNRVSILFNGAKGYTGKIINDDLIELEAGTYGVTGTPTNKISRIKCEELFLGNEKEGNTAILPAPQPSFSPSVPGEGAAVEQKNTSELSVPVITTTTDISLFKLLSPSKDNAILKDPLGQGVSFKWEDAGTGLYYIQVRDTNNILWGAITKQTSINYGKQSLDVPVSLSNRFIISKINPNTSRNEVKFKGLANDKQYTVSVTALKTLPIVGELAEATSVLIRESLIFSFLVDLP
jgi:hypothetical protein